MTAALPPRQAEIPSRKIPDPSVSHAAPYVAMALNYDLPPRQYEILLLLREARTQGRPWPTYRDLADRLGLRSTSTIYHHVRGLEAKNLVTVPKGANRALRLTEDVRCPHCGGAL